MEIRGKIERIRAMSFNGSLLTIGGSDFPLQYVFRDSYKITPLRRLDLDSTRTTSGYLQRNVLSHTATTISFSTKPMYNDEMSAMWSFIRSAYISLAEKKVSLVYYVPETDSYSSGYFYIPDFEFSINLIDTTTNKILYNSSTLEFIEY